MIIDKFFKKTFILSAIVYFISLLISWPAAHLFGSMVSKYSGSSLFLSRMAERIDPLFLSDFISNVKHSLYLLTAVIGPIIFIYFLVQILLSAGIMESFSSSEAPLSKSLGSGITIFGPRFIFLYLLFIPIYLIAGGVTYGLLYLIKKVLSLSGSEMLPIYFGIVQVSIIFLILLAVHTLHYAIRADMVASGEKFWNTIRRVLKRKFSFFVSLFIRFLLIVVIGAFIVKVLTFLGFQLYSKGLLLLVVLQLATFIHIALKVYVQGIFVSRCIKIPLPTLEKIVQYATSNNQNISMESESEIEQLKEGERLIEEKIKDSEENKNTTEQNGAEGVNPTEKGEE